MNYKINLDKKKEFEKWNYKQMLKHFFPFMIPAFLLMDFVMGFVFSNNTEFPLPISTTIKIILFSNIVFFIIFFICILFGIKRVSSKLETWELNIEENYAILKNSSAITTVNFADFNKFKKDNNSITFYFKGMRRFYINWDCFINSENLKSELENIASRIGTFTRPELSIEQPKTKVKFNSKFNLFFYIILGIIVIVRILMIFLK